MRRELPKDVEEALGAVLAGAAPRTLEGSTLEFKRASDSFEEAARDLADAVACFANSEGGAVVVGVDDKIGGERAFAGCPHDSERLRRRLWELTNPSLAVTAITARYSNAVIVVLVVPPGLEVHTVSGRASHRVGSGCEPMSASQQARVIDDRRGVDWSAQRSGRPPGQASAVAMETARQLLRNNPDPQRQAYSRLHDPDLLRALGLVTGEGEFLRAGELLLCDGAESMDLIVYQHRRSPSGEPAYIQRLRRPLLVALQRTMELITARIDRTPILLPTGQQVELADLPEGPVREALANAVAHRDWRLPDPISVEHSPTRLVVDSPGPLVSGVTVDNILAHPSKPRNRVLAEAVRKLGLAEQAGVGIDRMYRDMIRSGHAPPHITESDYVRVTLTGGAPNKPLARYVASLPDMAADDADAMLVLFTLLTKRTITAGDLERVLQKPPVEIEVVLRGLASDDVAMLEPSRQTAARRFPSYRLREHVFRQLGTAVTYRRRTTDEIDRKVITTVAELGSVTNSVVQTLFDVGVDRASAILADLVERKLLVKTSPNERGPGVRYGPGPAFPRSASGRRRS